MEVRPFEVGLRLGVAKANLGYDALLGGAGAFKACRSEHLLVGEVSDAGGQPAEALAGEFWKAEELAAPR